jgi:hypothetical protein
MPPNWWSASLTASCEELPEDELGQACYGFHDLCVRGTWRWQGGAFPPSSLRPTPGHAGRDGTGRDAE